MGVWLIAGIPGAGKSTVSRMLAGSFVRGAHVEGDRIGEMVVGGIVRPGEEPQDESNRQMELTVRNQCLLARSFAEAGFVPVLDYVVVTRERLDLYRELLGGMELHFVVLHPGKEVALRRDRDRPEKTVAAAFVELEDVMVEELSGVGLWVESGRLTAEETVARILTDPAASRL
jgi:predicted kinase